MTEGKPANVLEAELLLAPSATRNESACLVGGSAGLGAAPNFGSLSSLYTWYLFVTVSAKLVLAGIATIFHRTLGR